MAGELTAPLVPGVSSIGEVMARATQAAAVQSAQILSAARNIAADRQRAGEMAADAVVRMRLEDFQKEQFRQKKTIEDAHLGISLATSRRLEAREPLERKLLQAEIDQAPLRTALIGAQLTGTQLRNTQDATTLLNFPEELERRREREDLVTKGAKLDYDIAQGEFDDATTADMDIKTLANLMTNTDLSDNDSLTYALQLLDGMRNPESDTSVLKDPRVAKVFNAAVEKLGTDEEMKASLRIPEEVISAIQPETSMGLRTGTEMRMRLDAERDAKISKAEAQIRIHKSNKDVYRGQTSKTAKTSVALLDEKIRLEEQKKIDAQNDFQTKLNQLNATSNGFLPAGPREIDPTLLDDPNQTKINKLLKGLE